MAQVPIQFGSAYDGEKMRLFAQGVLVQQQNASSRLSKLESNEPALLNIDSAAETAYTLLMADDTVICDCTTAAVTLKLPADLTVDDIGKTFTTGKIDGTHNLVTDGNGANINGAGTHTNSTQWRCDTFKWMGAAWIISGHS